MNRQELLDRVAEVRVWKRAGERAVSKPLLLLLALAKCVQEVRDLRFADVDPIIQDLLREFGPHRQRYSPEYPFWRLQNDGLWEVEDAEDLPRRQSNTDAKRSVLLERNVAARFPEEIYDLFAANHQLVYEVAHSILDSHFAESMHDEILSAIGLSIDWSTSRRRRRDPGFRERILNAYEHRCAICGFSVHLGSSEIGIEAAHIRWHQAGGADAENNGLALCVMHHKLFDRGALTVHEEDLTVRVSELAHGAGGFADWVTGFHGRQITLPDRPTYRPEPKNLRWHWRQVFRPPPRFP